MTPPGACARRTSRCKLRHLVIGLGIAAGIAGCAGPDRHPDHRPPPMEPLPPRVEPQSQSQYLDPAPGNVSASPLLLPYHGHTKTRALSKGRGMWIQEQDGRDRPPPRRYG